jgi:hypothetical protein
LFMVGLEQHNGNSNGYFNIHYQYITATCGILRTIVIALWSIATWF